MLWFDSSKRRGQRSWLGLLAAGWLGLHGAAWYGLRNVPAMPADALPIAAVAITVLLLVLGTFMFSSGLKSSVDSLFERGDVDLLLSSPLPSRSIFTVRLTGITLGVASVYLALAGPVVNAGLFTGHAAWLAVYPVILACTSICCSLAMLLTLLLVRVLGARKTRVVAQVLSAIAGALIFLLAQAQNLLHLGSPQQAAALVTHAMTPGSALAPDSVIWSAGRAALGGVTPLLCLLALAGGLFLLTVRFTHGFFVRGLQQAVSTVRARKPGARTAPGRFGQPLVNVVLRKEWRLIVRDPHLLSQVLLQLLYLLPLALLVLRSDGAATPAVGAGLVMLSASLTASLTWIVVSAEDAPDLLLASPAAARVIRRAKLGAAVLPPLALVALPVLWSLAQHVVAGLCLSLTVMAATACAALTGLWQGRPAPRGNFKTRSKSNILGSILEMVGTLAWALTGFVLIHAAGPEQTAYDARWAGISLALALLTLLLAWGTRRRAG